MLAQDHLAGGVHYGFGHVWGEHAELGVHHRGGRLDLGQRPDLRRLQTTAGDRKILHGPLGLGLPQRVGGYPHLAHRVVLDPKVGHGFILPRPVGARTSC